MAMSNNKKEAQLKTSADELVGPLLKRLNEAREKVRKDTQTEKIIDEICEVRKDTQTEKIIDEICAKVQNTKDNLHIRKNGDMELIGYLGKIERQIDYLVDHNNTKTELDEHTLTDLEVIINQLSQNWGANLPKATREKASDSRQKAKIAEDSESSNSYDENTVSMTLKIIESFDDPRIVRCLYCLGIFPENTKIKKKLVIYWWIAMGLLSGEQGEFFFSYLGSSGVLTPVNVREHNQVIDTYTIKPTIHKQLISACKRAGNFISKEKDGNWLIYNEERDGNFISEERDGTWHIYNENKFNMNVLLNLYQRYLSYEDINAINKKNDLRVIQLGTWHYTETEFHNRVEETASEEAKSKDHIEVDETHFLKLGEGVTYLSLRGISRIDELPESIGNLENLKILDLRACHNLEILPQKPSSKFKPKLIRWALPQKRWFKNLMVLDISECYLLDHMPKWVCELSNLEVLKGFVVGSMGNKSQSCQLGDLDKLTKLWKLSIRIAIGCSVSEDFSALKDLDSLLILTITWGGTKDNYTNTTYSFPEGLEKLDIRCYPQTEASELLNPAKLKNLKRLYIRGGKLTKIRDDVKWKVEILRLKFLKDLKTNWVELRSSFENLKYVEYVDCPNLENFPEGGSHRIKQKDEHNQSGNASETSNQS